MAFCERLAFPTGAKGWMRGEGEGGREEGEERFEVRVEDSCRGIVVESVSINETGREVKSGLRGRTGELTRQCQAPTQPPTHQR